MKKKSKRALVIIANFSVNVGDSFLERGIFCYLSRLLSTTVVELCAGVRMLKFLHKSGIEVSRAEFGRNFNSSQIISLSGF